MGLPSHNVRLAKPNSAGVYVRHRPETTLLYQLVQEYWPEFQVELASYGRYLPAYVTNEFDEYLKCGRLGSKPAVMGKVLGIVYRAIATYLTRKASYTKAMDASDEDPSNQLLGSSITYRVAVGPHQGRKVFTRNGQVRYELKTPWRNGTR